MSEMMDCEHCYCYHCINQANWYPQYICVVSKELVGRGIKQCDCPVTRMELRDGTVYEPHVRIDVLEEES